MTWLGSAVAVAVAMGACSPGSTTVQGPSPGGIATSIPVTKVTDGDTMHVTYRGADERVRLIGIDTPEVPWYGGTAECFGVEAGLYARGRLAGRSVRLVFDVDLRDRYGRLLAYVYVGDELFNLSLVEQGYARADPVPPDTRLAQSFAEAEAAARAADRGLWRACAGPSP